MSKLLARVKAALFPNRCAYCGSVIPEGALCCARCDRELPRIRGKVCAKCGREKEFCSCAGREQYFISAAAPFYYEGKVRSAISRFKFQSGTSLCDAFAGEMKLAVEKRFPDVRFDLIVTVPLTAKSAARRGYDQCDLIARRLSELTGIEYLPCAIKKIYETGKQHEMRGIFRRGNLAGVFDVTSPGAVEGKNILLIDDISTSGETLGECAKMLWLCSAGSIYCATVALTKSKKKQQKGENRDGN